VQAQNLSGEKDIILEKTERESSKPKLSELPGTKDLLSTPSDARRTVQPALSKVTRKCPVYCIPNEDGKGYGISLNFETSEENIKPENIYNEKLCELTGTKNRELAANIIKDAASAICGYSNFGSKKNIVLQSLSEQQPKDIHEARLCAQAAALYSQGLDYLDRARSVLFDEGTFAKDHWHIIFMKAAVRLLDLHTKTVTELARYKQNGEQRIIVQHVQVNDGGQAIVGGVLNRSGGK